MVKWATIQNLKYLKQWVDLQESTWRVILTIEKDLNDSCVGHTHSMDTSMGQLKPGATYIYESPDGGETTYAREIGTTDRVMIGQSHRAQSMREQIQEDKLWGEIRRKAKTHPGLQAELERVIMFYTLLQQKDEIMWHPV